MSDTPGEVVTEVHSISAAPPGWIVAHSGQAVACFALVTTTTAAHPGQFNERRVIPLTAQWVNADLLGMPIGLSDHDVEYTG